jgi:signal transduction histidine kinase
MNVLIVDDDRLNLKVAEGYIHMFFPEDTTILCSDPREVFEILDNNNVDIILLDIMMPYMSGIEVLEKIKKDKKHDDIEIIMLTALVDDENFVKCFDLGASDYLSKPINSMKLKARISGAYRNRSNKKMQLELYDKLKVQNEELLKLNDALKEAQFSMIKSEKLAAIGELAAGVAHEINNPIGYVGSNVTTMAKYLFKMAEYITYTNDKLKVYNENPNLSIGEIKAELEEKFKALKMKDIVEDLPDITEDCNDGVNKISKIVRALSSFARTGLGDEKLYCSYEEIISQILIIIKNEYKYAIKIETVYESMKDVLLNKVEYSQVVLNILINAIHAIKDSGKEQGGLIVIKTYTEESYTCVSIKDNGPGIPESNRSKIFDPFFTTKKSGHGTGLGLSISYNIIVNKHNGLLTVESEEGVGTEFIIKLPKEN